MGRQHPLVHWNVRALVNGPDRGRERLVAILALVDAAASGLAPEPGRAIDAAALGANRAFGPNGGFKMSPSGVFVGENRVGEIGGHFC